MEGSRDPSNLSDFDEVGAVNDDNSISEQDIASDRADDGSENTSNNDWRIDVFPISRSSIFPNNNSLIWPQNYQNRRVKFSTLVKRYYDQLLYGCSQPYCVTPSCLSYRKRKAKGPFRPYTVLTARALATSLASEDYSEDGICPYLSVKDIGGDVPDSFHQIDTHDSTNIHDTSVLTFKLDKIEDKKNVVDGTPEEAPAPGVTTTKLEKREKDYKSFAQNLFDTRAMRLLTLAESSPILDLTSKEMTQPFAKTSCLPRSNDITVPDTNEVSKVQENTQSRDPDQDLEEDERNLRHEQCDLGEAINAEIYRELFVALQKERRDPEADQFVTSGTDHVLAYFSFSNLSRLFHGARMIGRKTNAEELRRLRDIFNRPIGPSNPFEKGSSKAIQYVWFIRRSISYICNTPDALLRSFVEWREDSKTYVIVRSHRFQIIAHVFQCLLDCDESAILLSNPWTSLNFIDRPRFDPTRLNGFEYRPASDSPGGRHRRQKSFPGVNQILSDTDAAHIAKIALAALVSHIGDLPVEALNIIVQIRGRGQEVPPITPSRANIDKYDMLVDTIDKFENEAAISLATRLAKVMGSRRWEEIQKSPALRPGEPKGDEYLSLFMVYLVRNIAEYDGLTVFVKSDMSPPSLRGGTEIRRAEPGMFAAHDGHNKWTHLAVEWMRTVVIKEWNGEVEVPRRSAIGGALEFLRHMYFCCSRDEIPLETYHTPYIADRLDILKVPISWANGKTASEMVHLLSYPFLFRPSVLVTYFRAINYHTMAKASHAASINGEMLRKFNYENIKERPGRGAIRSFDSVRPSVAKYLVLDIRRDHVLEDAIDQLWRREPGELMKPCKIRMGMNQGEEGMDLGGVSQEFFRLAIAEAMDPKYGAFTTDPETQMTWFQPGSLEPLHLFETVGILTSLAIYNGLTLPFTFPRALYRAIVGLRNEIIDDISDGWPTLARSLETLLDWSGDNVEEIFMRPYVFSTDVFGTAVDIKMDHERLRTRLPPCEPPNTPPPTPKMVTNHNRHAFVRDYILHLTLHSVHPQLSAFIAGFRRCLPHPVHELFTEDSLKDLIEGQSEIDTHALEQVTRYEHPYHADHPTIRQFWTVVHGWGSNNKNDNPTSPEPDPHPTSNTSNTGSPIIIINDSDPTVPTASSSSSPPEEETDGPTLVRKLLEFVTATDRLPVGGVWRTQFVIQRNGEGDERLPSSMTCFGRLLLPEFSGVEALRRGLERAVTEGVGFGLQ